MVSFENAALTGNEDGLPVFEEEEDGFAGTRLTFVDDEEAVVDAIAHL
jgi:hypothetical protein